MFWHAFGNSFTVISPVIFAASYIAKPVASCHSVDGLLRVFDAAQSSVVLGLPVAIFIGLAMAAVDSVFHPHDNAGA